MAENPLDQLHRLTAAAKVAGWTEHEMLALVASQLRIAYEAAQAARTLLRMTCPPPTAPDALTARRTAYSAALDTIHRTAGDALYAVGLVAGDAPGDVADRVATDPLITD